MFLTNGDKFSAYLFLLLFNNFATLSKYGHDALNICQPYATDILRYIYIYSVI